MSYSPEFREGDTVVFRGETEAQRRWGGNDDGQSLLIVGRTYVVEKVETHSWHTKLHLAHVRGRFNSVCFGLVGPHDT